MRDVFFRSAMGIVIAAGATLAAVANADDQVCQKPAAFTFSSNLSSEAEANAVGAEIERAMDASITYLKCLDAKLTNDSSTLSSSERRQIERDIESEIAAMEMLAAKWNSAYQSYANRKASK